MKNLLLASLLFLSMPSYSSVSGLEMNEILGAALTESSFEIDNNSIMAWNIEFDAHEAVVTLLNSDDIKMTYGCHPHGQNMVCHEEGHEQGKNKYKKESEATLAYMQSGFDAAVAKFSKTIARKGLDLSIVENAKVWVGEDNHGHGGHHHSTDIWTKFNFEMDGVDRVIFTQCHMEEGESVFACHYSSTAPNEVELEDDHGHDHGHGHGHSH